MEPLSVTQPRLSGTQPRSWINSAGAIIEKITKQTQIITLMGAS